MSADHFSLAIANIACYGDTDVFPSPLENSVFFDMPLESEALLVAADANFDDWLVDYPMVNEASLAVVGYTGFRKATQIDPLWNAYILSQVLKVAP